MGASCSCKGAPAKFIIVTTIVIAVVIMDDDDALVPY
jgi:hypothetical protein